MKGTQITMNLSNDGKRARQRGLSSYTHEETVLFVAPFFFEVVMRHSYLSRILSSRVSITLMKIGDSPIKGGILKRNKDRKKE